MAIAVKLLIVHLLMLVTVSCVCSAPVLEDIDNEVDLDSAPDNFSFTVIHNYPSLDSNQLRILLPYLIRALAAERQFNRRSAGSSLRRNSLLNLWSQLDSSQDDTFDSSDNFLIDPRSL